MKYLTQFIGTLICLILAVNPQAQVPDYIYHNNVKSVKLYTYGNQLGYPAIRLNSNDRIELHFDDMEGGVKSYSYTWQICNADWTVAQLSPFDFIKGFTQQRITTYRPSSIAFTQYTHYQAVLPDKSCMPSRSGNYLLKVFLNGDTSKLAFTRRVLVYEERSTIPAQVQQPFSGQGFYTDQKIAFVVNTKSNVDLINAIQQVKVTILQNNRWDNAITNIKPTFIRPNQLEYNTETDAVFPGGKEWRWLDLRSFRLQSDRVANAIYKTDATEIFVKPDVDRSQLRFVFYRDNGGMYTIEASESINPFWQADYATVHFSFVPPGKIPFANKDVYLFGELSNYGMLDAAKMQFNNEKGVYETSLFLKQGYYDYSYVTVDATDPKQRASFMLTEGNSWETENNYTILVYYRAFADRTDALIGYTKINSLMGRQ